MARKNQTVETVEDPEVEETGPAMTIEDAQKILKSPSDFSPLQVAHATRRIDAMRRNALAPSDRAKEDFSGYVNDAANRILNGGKRTIAGACHRFSIVDRETKTSLLSHEDLHAGLDYLVSCIEKARAEIGVALEEKKAGFSL